MTSEYKATALPTEPARSEGWDSSASGLGSLINCRTRNETAGCIKGGEFVDYLKKDSPPLS
jgi:hypothetical protein